MRITKRIMPVRAKKNRYPFPALNCEADAMIIISPSTYHPSPAEYPTKDKKIIDKGIITRSGKPFLSLSLTKGTAQEIKNIRVKIENTPPESAKNPQEGTNFDRDRSKMEIGAETKWILFNTFSGIQIVRIPNNNPTKAPSTSFAI